MKDEKKENEFVLVKERDSTENLLSISCTIVFCRIDENGDYQREKGDPIVVAGRRYEDGIPRHSVTDMSDEKITINGYGLSIPSVFIDMENKKVLVDGEVLNLSKEK